MTYHINLILKMKYNIKIYDKYNILNLILKIFNLKIFTSYHMCIYNIFAIFLY